MPVIPPQLGTEVSPTSSIAFHLLIFIQALLSVLCSCDKGTPTPDLGRIPHRFLLNPDPIGFS